MTGSESGKSTSNAHSGPIAPGMGEGALVAGMRGKPRSVWSANAAFGRNGDGALTGHWQFQERLVAVADVATW